MEVWVYQGIAELPRDIRIATDFSINERILGISTEGPEKYVRLSWATCYYFWCCSAAGFPCPNGQRKPDSRKRERWLRPFVLDDVNEAETELENVDIERILRLL